MLGSGQPTTAVSESEIAKEEARSELERLAGFDAKAAKEELLDKVEDEARRDAMVLVRDLELKAREEAERRARRILTGAVSSGWRRPWSPRRRYRWCRCRPTT